MALQKQGINISFGQGLDTKTDPFQVQAGKMLALSNTIFTTGGSLVKRNGFPKLTELPNTEQTTLTTSNSNLVATGSDLYAFSPETNQWLNQGLVQPLELSTVPLVRTSTSQSSVDAAIAASGLVCLVYFDNSIPYYKVSDSVTGQQIVAPTALPATAHGMRVFILGRYFLITFTATVSGIPHLQYLAIPVASPSTVASPVDISTTVISVTDRYDAMVANNTLYISWINSNPNTVSTKFITSSLIVSSAADTLYSGIVTGNNRVSVTVDISQTTAVIWTTIFNESSTSIDTFALDHTLQSVLGVTNVVMGVTCPEITSIATGMVLTVYYEVYNTIYSGNYQTDYTSTNTVSQSGTIGTPTVVLRSVGIASKAFLWQDTQYLLLTYGQRSLNPDVLSFQPTYFLSDGAGNIIMKFAYSNGPGYLTSILPSVSLIGNDISIPYLVADLLVPVNKAMGAATAAGILTQFGINLATFQINTVNQHSAEIAGCLFLTGGFLWQYDGVKPVELGFQVWPEGINGGMSGSGGLITAQDYFYVFTYEWTDAQGNLHRSAPSVPFELIASTGTSSATLTVPTLRLTYKTNPNPVRIVGYRWSTAQQIFYQFTSISSPVINDPTVDFVTVTDTLADSAILGNTILYTTGGVLEHIAPPACSALALYKSRLMLLNAEDKNQVWFSNQVIENTTVEMSDGLTLYVAPTTGAQGSTGNLTAISAMDDKFIPFKKDALYYITGTGPDITGANNDFSDPIFISGTVGCANQNSIVLQPEGLMFQSDKGIWMLGRDLSTQYIGAPVESFNNNLIKSSLTIPGTNQVRFTLNNSTTLMFDYYYQQWGTFTGIPGLSSTLYNGAHTFLNADGLVLQETPGTYLDNSTPVLMSFTTAWIKLTNLQGFQRAYWLFLLGNYLTPHKLVVQLKYDYNPGVWQQTIISPTNFSPVYGADPLYGSGSPYGGANSLEQWRIFLDRQKCQAIQLSIEEVFDNTKGVVAGAGFTLSGMNMTIGAKLGFPKVAASESTS